MIFFYILLVRYCLIKSSFFIYHPVYWLVPLTARYSRWKMAMKLSDNLLVSKASGNSRKYCFTMSATSYAWWFSNFMLSGSDSASCLSRCIRDLTPGLRNRPTWSRALSSSHRKADWINGGNAKPFFCTFVINGTPKTALSNNENDYNNGNNSNTDDNNNSVNPDTLCPPPPI